MHFIVSLISAALLLSGQVNGQLNRLLFNLGPGGSFCLTKSTVTATGFRLVLQTCTASDSNQYFLFDSQQRLTFTVGSLVYCVSDSVSSSTSTSSSVAELVSCSPTVNLFQRWTLVRSNNDFKIQSQGNTGKCLDSQSSQSVGGQLIYMNPCAVTATQSWKRSFLCNMGEQPNQLVDGCEVCPTNRFKMNQAYVPCDPCPLGATCAYPDRNPICDAGYRFIASGQDCESCILYTNYKPLSANRQCTICLNDNGLVCGTTTTLTCDAGFQWKTTGVDCEQCAMGKYKSTRGNSTCRDCLIGTESNTGRTACQDCAAGYYRDRLTMPQCAPCPANSYCEKTFYECYPGYGHNEVTKTCDICDNRQYKPTRSNSACLPCPTNQLSNSNRTSCSSQCQPGSCVDFGISQRHNAVILGDYAGSSDIQGSIAIGGNAFFADGYSVADRINITVLVNQTCDTYNVIVKGFLSWGSGRLYSGSIAVGQQSVINSNVVVPDCRVDRKTDAFDFDLARSQLQTLSSLLANGSSTVVSKSIDAGGIMNITFAGNAIEVLELAAFDLGTKVKQIGVIKGVTNSSLILVNIRGTSAAMKLMNMEAFAAYNVLFNFPQATQLEINGIAVRGGILAPFATSLNATGAIWGPVYIKLLSGPIQINLRPLMCNCSTVLFGTGNIVAPSPDQLSPYNNFFFGTNGAGYGGGGSGTTVTSARNNSTTSRSSTTIDPSFKQQSADSMHSYILSLELVISIVIMMIILI